MLIFLRQSNDYDKAAFKGANGEYTHRFPIHSATREDAFDVPVGQTRNEWLIMEQYNSQIHGIMPHPELYFVGPAHVGSGAYATSNPQDKVEDWIREAHHNNKKRFSIEIRLTVHIMVHNPTLSAGERHQVQPPPASSQGPRPPPPPFPPGPLQTRSAHPHNPNA